MEIKRGHMAFVGSKTPAGAYASIVKSMPYFFSAKNVKKGDSYCQTVFFDFKHLKPYADVLIDYVKLEGGDANYSGMARAYRKYKLESGAVRPLSEKIKERPALEYCVYAPEIRVRQGWKPAPPKVIHQTLENEPEMKVVVTFDRVGDIVRELKRQGVDKAEICLVGWNKSGHDGRYPQMFPVEPKLGGEAKLRELIKNTLADGYQITCHTNSTDAYEIADVWSEEYIIKKPDGSLQKNPTPWSGGEMYDVCWKRAYERFGEHDLAKVADLGFKGMHYIDVSTCVPARECFDPRHPTTPEEASAYMNKIFEYCNKTFGGSMSEGGYDHGFSVVDSVLYVSFALGRDKLYLYWDDLVPVWQIVYHGIVLYNPGPYTINHSIKDAKTRLKFVEFGGRPSFYFHSKFRDSGNWMGQRRHHLRDRRKTRPRRVENQGGVRRIQEARPPATPIHGKPRADCRRRVFHRLLRRHGNCFKLFRQAFCAQGRFGAVAGLQSVRKIVARAARLAPPLQYIACSAARKTPETRLRFGRFFSCRQGRHEF